MLAHDPVLAIGARFVVGIGTAMGFIGGLEYVRAISGSPVVQGMFGGVGVSAGAVALAVVPQIDRLVAWRAPFLTASLVALAGIVLLDRAPDVRARNAPHRGVIATPIARLLIDRRLQQISIVYAGSLGLSIAASNWIVSLLVREGGVSHTVAGPIASLSLLAGILTRPLGGWALQHDAVWMRRAVTVSIAGGVAGTLAVAAARPLPLVVAGSVLVGLCAGFPFAPALNAAVGARPDAPGAAVGFVNMCGAFTILAWVPLLGLTFSLPGGGRTGCVTVALVWGACVLAVPGAFATATPPPTTTTIADAHEARPA